jgi:hypothetical protein
MGSFMVIMSDILGGGVLTQTLNYTHGSDPLNPAIPNGFLFRANRNSGYGGYNGSGGGALNSTGGFPSGQIGIYGTVPASSMSQLLISVDTSQRDMAGRWTNKGVNSYDTLDLYNAINPTTGRLDLPYLAIRQPIFLKNLRLKKFCMTFSVRRNRADSRVAMQAFFNGQDQDTADSVIIFHGDTPLAPQGSSGGGTGTVGNVPALTSTSIMWCNLTFDGTTLSVKAQAGATEPAFSSWASVSACYTNTSFSNVGGMLGFAGYADYPSVGAIKVRSYDTATSAFDILEHVETGALDTSGFTTGDTLTNDSNGNLTFDGTAVYTYDAWNRLKSIAHAYRDGSGTLYSGQTSETMSYDAQGRRITKAITGTGMGLHVQLLPRQAERGGGAEWIGPDDQAILVGIAIYR